MEVDPIDPTATASESLLSRLRSQPDLEVREGLPSATKRKMVADPTTITREELNRRHMTDQRSSRLLCMKRDKS